MGERQPQNRARLETISRLYALLSQISRAVVRNRTRDDLLRDVCTVAHRFGGFRMAWIGLLDEATGAVKPFVHAGAEEGYLERIGVGARNVPAGTGPTGAALREGTVVVCDDIAADPRMRPWRDAALERGYRSSAAVPFLLGNRALGTLNLYAGEPGFFTEEHRDLLEELGATLSFALDAITARQVLQEREEQLRFLNEHLAEGMVYQVDSGRDGRQRRFSYLSPAVERFHGLAVEEVLRDPGLIYGQVAAEHRERLARAEAEAFEARRPLDVEVPVRLPSGELRWRRFLSAPAADPDGRVLWSGIELDVTERRSMEEAVRQREQDRREIQRLQAQIERTQTLESVGRLAGGVAHDFNNMLGVILGRAELALLEAGQPEVVRESLEEICGAARRSADLTRQLLAFARRQTVVPRVLDLNELVAGTLKMLRRLIGEDVDLVWMPGAGLGSVRVDPAQVDQILANLCVNARDAIAGVGRITIRTENATLDEEFCREIGGCRPGPYVLLRVTDTGHGMPPEVLEHVFEPFFTTKEVGQGTGLGLATVYGIVRQNDGQIAVESEPDAGTSFAVYLPRVADADEDAAVPPPAAPPAGRGETLLLVEDERAILRMARAMLESLGYHVLAAPSPAEALRAAAAHAGVIHLLLSDVVMPGMNGRDLAGRLAALRPGVGSLFMSGHSADVISRHGVLEPGVRFLQKPFTRASLAVAVREALDGPRPTEAAPSTGKGQEPPRPTTPAPPDRAAGSRGS